MKISHQLLIVLFCLGVSSGVAVFQAQGVPELVAATDAFLASLDEDQKTIATFDFNDDERLNWHFIPRERKGVAMKGLVPHQQALVHTMISAALGYRGVMKATTIMSLEDVLRQIEGPESRFRRDPELYYVSVFGEPSTSGTWAWRIEGHHLAVNITMQNGRVLASSPLFMGSNPAEIFEGPRAGLRALGTDEN